MNLLIFSNRFFPEGRGGELATYLYARLLSENAINVKVVAFSSSSVQKSEVNGLTVFRIPTRKVTKYSTIGRIPLLFKGSLRSLIEWSDVIYMTGWFPAILVIKQIPRFRRPVVVHLHSSFPVCPIGSSYNLTKNSLCTNSVFSRCATCVMHYEKSNDKGILEVLASGLLNSTIGLTYKNFLKYADAIIFVSDFQKRLVLKQIPVITNKSFVIHNPLPKLHYIAIRGNDVGYFGGTSLLKGFLVLMRAWFKICNKYNSKLHISLAERIFKHKAILRKKKIVLHGKLSGRVYDKVYESVKAVVVPSIVPEALPYVVSEACLRGRLLIASRVGGVPEAVNGASGARLIPPGDTNTLADALDWVLSMNLRDAVELGLKNREYVLKRFSNERSAKSLIKVFERVLSR